MHDAHGRPNTLTAATGSPAWQAGRQAMLPAFAPAALRAAFPAVAAVASHAAAVVATAPAGRELDVDALALAAALDSMLAAGYGVRMGALDEHAAGLGWGGERAGANPLAGSGTGSGCGTGPDPRAAPPAASDDVLAAMPGVPPGVGTATLAALRACADEVARYALEPFRAILPFRMAIPVVRRGLAAFSEYRRVVQTVLDVAATAPSAIEGGPGALHARLRAAAGGNGAWLSREGGAVLQGGTESTAMTVATTLVALAVFPDCDARVAAELDAVGLLANPGAPPRPMVWDDVSRLPYLSACIKAGSPGVGVGAEGGCGGRRLPTWAMKWKMAVRAAAAARPPARPALPRHGLPKPAPTLTPPSPDHPRPTPSPLWLCEGGPAPVPSRPHGHVETAGRGGDGARHRGRVPRPACRYQCVDAVLGHPPVPGQLGARR